MQYIIDRLKEPSTWRGLILVLSSLGIGIQPELADGIIAIGVGAAGVVGVVTKDK